jgi:RNA polymerase sigma-70 factor (ECF subfamily)
VNGDAPVSIQLPSAAETPADAGALDRLRRGDRAALEELVRRHHAPVARLVYRLAGYSPDADDLVQEVFFRAVRSARGFDGRASVSTWLARIAVNVCRTHHRRRFFRAAFWARWSGGRREEQADPAHQPLADAERDARVRVAVASLPFSYRQVVVLHYLEQRPVDDVARILGLSKGATEVRLHRARKMLEEQLRDFVKER